MPGLAKLLIFTAIRYSVHCRGDQIANAFCSAQTTLYITSGFSARAMQKLRPTCAPGRRAGQALFVRLTELIRRIAGA